MEVWQISHERYLYMLKLEYLLTHSLNIKLNMNLNVLYTTMKIHTFGLSCSALNISMVVFK